MLYLKYYAYLCSVRLNERNKKEIILLTILKIIIMARKKDEFCDPYSIKMTEEIIERNESVKRALKNLLVRIECEEKRNINHDNLAHLKRIINQYK